MPTTALITGASSGLGAEFAELFAADKKDLVLVARRKDRLDALAEKLHKAHGVRAHVVPLDLGRVDAVPALVAELERLGVEVDELVNNAGFGTNGAFWEIDAARELEEVQVNVTVLVALTRALLPGMVSRGRGRVLSIGSTAGFQPGPFMATYYATKAFVNSFSEALSYELKGTGVTSTVSCPGATLTEFGQVSGVGSARLFKFGAMTAAEVAAQAYRAMQAGKPTIVHGLKNKLGAFAVRISPKATLRAIAASLNRTPSVPRLPSGGRA